MKKYMYIKAYPAVKKGFFKCYGFIIRKIIYFFQIMITFKQ